MGILFIVSFVTIFQLEIYIHAHTHTHTHTCTHRQHGNIISIVLFLLREESWLKTVVLLVASYGCEAVTLKEEQIMRIIE
jgi:hypothetical protein